MQRDEAPDPSRVLSTDEFMRQLRLLKVWAGDPSYDELRRRTGLARSTLFDGLRLRRSRPPSLDLVRRVVAACGRGPEEVARWETAWRRLRHEAGPLQAAVDVPPRRAAAPRQLPVDVPGFVGREEQLARLDALTAPPPGHAPVVVISGPAGVGKSALAVRWAHRVAARFPDGQLHVDLRGHSLGPELPPAQALGLLLAALGAPEEQLPVGQDALVGRYRTVTADRRLLLLLDNAASVAQVRPLLPSGPGCAVLVTSRSGLGGLMARDGASPLRLGVLNDTESRRLLRDALGVDRVSAEREAVAELTRLCGHLPLALRIAAAQLAERADGSIAAYAAELGSGDRLAGLAVDGDEESAVRAAFDLSYAALSPEARLLFRRLGAAPTPSIGPAAAAVLAGVEADRAATLLGGLADAHLVELAGAGEHRLHDLVRLYAAERAEREDGETAHQAVTRLLQWYAASARAAGELVAPTVSYLPSVGGPALGFADRDEAYDWLERQRDNLAAAVEHAAGQRLWPTVIALVDGVRGFLQLRGYRADWLSLVHVGLDAARYAGDERALAAMHMSAGLAHWSAGDAQQGIEHYDQCLQLQRGLGNRVGEAGTLSNLGMAYHSLGQPDEAVSYHTEALAVSREIGDQDREADALNNLGFLCCELGRLDEAAESLHQARRRYQELRRPEREAAAEVNLGLTRYEQGRLAEASAHYRRGLELAHRTGRGVLAEITCNLARVQQDLGDYRQATRYARRALTLAEETHDRVVEAAALNAYGAVLTLRGAPGQAAPYHERALRVALRMGHPRSEAEARLGLASAWLADGAAGSAGGAVGASGGAAGSAGPGEAAAQAERAVEIARSGLGLLLGRALTTASAVCLAGGEPERAREFAVEAVAECRRRGQRLMEARALLALGRAQRDRGSPEAAGESWSAASALVESMGVPESEVLRALLAVD